MTKIGILGAGTWGSALAATLSGAGFPVTLWSALATEVNELKRTRVHPNLPGAAIPEDVAITGDIAQAVEGKELVLFAVPSVYLRETAAKAAPFLKKGQILADAAKGIEPETLLFMTEVIGDAIEKAGNPEKFPVVALSGPTHAEEVAVGLPTTIISASDDLDAAKFAQSLFANTCIRAYTNTDVRGVELSGALKNVIALACGISTGLGFGDNVKAAIITRGIAEIGRLGAALGCRPETFSGLAGIGDLIVTATSRHSRNNRAGEMIGAGAKPSDAVKAVGMVVEGVNALPAVMELIRRTGVEMPIVEAVNAVVNGGKDPKEMVTVLMAREMKDEIDGYAV